MNKIQNKEKKEQTSQDLVTEVHDLLWVYLYYKKTFSQRQLAMLLVDDLKKQGVKLSMETVQRVFLKTQTQSLADIKKILYTRFQQEGFTSKKSVRAYVADHCAEACAAYSFVPTEQVIKLSDLWLQVNKNKSKSKRKLAKILQATLKDEGFEYHLGSLQNILCGKIQETKAMIYDALKKMLLKSNFASEADLQKGLDDMSKEDVFLFKAVSSESLYKKSCEFLAAHPQWSKRKLAVQLSQDLAKQNYNISYNSLQYALAGKRNSVKKIVETTLDAYLQNPPQLLNMKTGPFVKQRTNSITSNLSRIYHMVKHSRDPAQKYKLSKVYFDTRKQEIMRLWQQRQNRHMKRMYMNVKTHAA